MLSARTTLQLLSGLLVALGLMGLAGRFMDDHWPVALAAPLALLTLGFIGVLALFLKDKPNG